MKNNEKKHENIARLNVEFGIKEGKNGVARDEKHERGVGVIRGFAVMTKGFVKDSRGWEIDDATLDQIVESGNRAKSGLKGRFGHPNMSGEALGTLLGRVKNFRKDGDIARADLFIDKTAYSTPNGDLATYVLDLAENDPEAFGSSVVLGDFELEARLDEKGNPEKDEEGNVLPALLRVKQLFAVDIVEEPAANNGLFNFFTESVRPSVEISAFLDRFLSNPDAVEKTIGFLERYRLNSDLTTHKNEGGCMEGLTLEILKAEHQAVFEAARKEGFDAGVASENLRVVSILESGSKFNGIGDLPLKAVKDKLGTKDAMIMFQQKKLETIQSGDKGVSPDALVAGSVASAPSGQLSAEAGRQREHIARAKEYASVHKCSMRDALRATYEKK